MKGIKWFQRLMITFLVATNAFVFMSMRDFEWKDNVLYTVVLITFCFLILTLIAYIQKSRKKKNTQDS